MKKILTVLLVCMLALLSAAPAPAENAPVRLAALKGPTAMGLVQVFEEHADEYDMLIAGSADEITPKLIQGQIDIAAVPINLASVLYNRTQGGIRLAAVNTLGVLYVIEKGGDSIVSIEDLKGKTIYATGKGSSPEYSLTWLLKAHGLEIGTDVTVEWKSEPTEERLKDTPRHCTTSRGRRESVAEHSWRISLMAFLLRDVFPEADIDKVTRMCLIHDLGECFTGDIPVFAKTDADRKTEGDLLAEWVRTLPQPLSDSMTALYAEMNAQETLESRIYKSLDRLEAVIQHNESPICTWEPHEYELNRTYAIDSVAFSPWLAALRQEILQDTLNKIETEKP